jgi:hypothetical protein
VADLIGTYDALLNLHAWAVAAPADQPPPQEPPPIPRSDGEKGGGFYQMSPQHQGRKRKREIDPSDSSGTDDYAKGVADEKRSGEVDAQRRRWRKKTTTVSAMATARMVGTGGVTFLSRGSSFSTLLGSPDLYRNLQIVCALLLQTTAPAVKTGTNGRENGASNHRGGLGDCGIALSKEQASAVQQTLDRSTAILRRLFSVSIRSKAADVLWTSDNEYFWGELLLSLDHLVVERDHASDDDDDDDDNHHHEDDESISKDDRGGHDHYRETFFRWRYDKDGATTSKITTITAESNPSALNKRQRRRRIIDFMAMDRRSLAEEEEQLLRMAYTPIPQQQQHPEPSREE